MEGGGLAVIKHAKGGVRVTYIPPKEIQQEVQKHKKDRKYMAAYKRWLADVRRELAEDAMRQRRLVLREKYITAMEKSQASNRGRKGAAERAKSREVEKKLNELSNNELLMYKPKDVYELRARRTLLKKRGLAG
ncbi:MAG: hypothetical protein N2047_10105 [Meiothermus sp.]|nr:hypothetical protein [Meiothermus sp.]